MSLPENLGNLKTSHFTYHLPDEAIARYPLANRDESKLLICKSGKISHHQFFELSRHLPHQSLLVFNNTLVVPARLHFQKPSGTWIEILVIKEMTSQDLGLATNQKMVECLVGNKKKWKAGEVLQLESQEKGLRMEVKWHDQESNLAIISWWPERQLFYEVLAQLGEMPIPPYLNREAEERDKTDYQTIYAREPGAIAAPTAGLHFTDRVMEGLRVAGVNMAEITLHVGLGTFKPMKTEKVTDHEMHAEEVIISREIVSQLAHHQGMTIAVGTTSMRSLESLFWMGLSAKSTNQIPEMLETGVPYKLAQSIETPTEVFQWLAQAMDERGMDEIRFYTRLFIMPGYQFRVVKGLITNFHQPESTLLVLISAFLGPQWQEVYKAALENQYRFLSYGDSSLLIPE